MPDPVSPEYMGELAALNREFERREREIHYAFLTNPDLPQYRKDILDRLILEHMGRIVAKDKEMEDAVEKAGLADMERHQAILDRFGDELLLLSVWHVDVAKRFIPIELQPAYEHQVMQRLFDTRDGLAAEYGPRLAELDRKYSIAVVPKASKSKNY